MPPLPRRAAACHADPVRRLVWMFALQLSLAPLLAFLAAVVADPSDLWENLKLNVTVALATALLGGAALGWVLASKPPADKPPASEGYRIGGAVLGVFVFGYIGLAVGLVVAYIVGGFDPLLLGGILGMLIGTRLGWVLAK